MADEQYQLAPGVYVNETTEDEHQIAPGVYLNETQAEAPPAGVGGSPFVGPFSGPFSGPLQRSA